MIDKIYKLIRVILTLMVVGVGIFYIYGQFFVKHEGFFQEEIEEYTNPWLYTDENGVTTEYYAPDSFSIEPNGTVAVSTVLPDNLKVGTCFFYRTGKDIKVYIDDELREEPGPAGRQPLQPDHVQGRRGPLRGEERSRGDRGLPESP